MTLFGLDGYRQSIPRGLPVDGSIIIPCKRIKTSVMKKTFKKGEYRRHLLLDPQLYLVGLEAARCAARCSALATYEWFPTGELQKENTSRQKTATKWMKKSKKVIKKYWTGELPTASEADVAVMQVARTQYELGCEAIVLAAPLTVNPNSDYSVELDWLDRGIAAAKQSSLFALPLIASIALSEKVLIGIDPFENVLLETIVDHVSVRSIDGVYIVVELGSTEGYYLESGQAVGALIRLVDAFKRAGIERIIVNYTTTAGLLAIAAGADTMCTGWYRSERRLRFEELPDTEKAGLTRPAFYSHPLGGEIHMKDLQRIAKSGKLEYFADETRFSEGLLRALRDGKKVSDVPEWRYLPSNNDSAKKHFYTAVAREIDRLRGLDEEQRHATAREWLVGASARAELLKELEEQDDVVGPEESDGDDDETGELHSRTSISHQDPWKNAFDAFVKLRSS
jgi:hypothetical protein